MSAPEIASHALIGLWFAFVLVMRIWIVRLGNEGAEPERDVAAERTLKPRPACDSGMKPR
jgi:hypothetical protein